MRLIDADSMKADLLTVDPRYEGMIQWCITVLDAQPTIEHKTGRWIKKDCDLFYCSECDLPSLHPWPYCERCGAKMEV